MSEHNLENKVGLYPKKVRFSLKLPFQRTHPYQEAEAFARLCENTHTIVVRYLFGFGSHSSAEAEDLTAETYERAWKARKRFSGNEDAAIGWLLTIARRLVIDKYRQQERQGIMIALPEQLAMNDDENPEQHTITQEQRQILWQLLDDLPVRSREILVLRYLIGWQVKQIAAHLELSENNVSTIIRRNLSRLRAEWPVTKEGMS
jgi:RNA polymerase sigma-70 factor (ECF subfamily)